MTRKSEYPKTDYGDMVDEFIDSNVSMNQQRYFNQFNILRFDMTLTGVVADNAFNYILDTDKSEEDIVKHLLEKTSDEYFGFER